MFTKKTKDWLHTQSKHIQRMRWQPKLQPGEYLWRAVVVSQLTDIECEYLFTTREQARKFKRATEIAMTGPRVTIEQVAAVGDGGWMTV